MAKPETTFRLSVERLLPAKERPHREKMNNTYSAGGADSWYSGDKADLWVEYKFIIVPKRDDTVIDLVGGKKPDLTVLQQDWLRCRAAEGRHVRVIVGCKEGGVVFPQPVHWEKPFTAGWFRTAIIDRRTIANLIASHTLGRP